MVQNINMVASFLTQCVDDSYRINIHVHFCEMTVNKLDYYYNYTNITVATNNHAYKTAVYTHTSKHLSILIISIVRTKFKQRRTL